MLVREGFDIDPQNFRGMSLYDTCEELIRIFGLHLKSPIYMQFFLDEVLNFSTGKNPAISGFLEHWEQKKIKTVSGSAVVARCSADHDHS